MILSKTPHKLGSIAGSLNFPKSKSGEILASDFLQSISETIERHVKNGIDVTCFQLSESDLPFPDFSDLEEEHPDLVLLDELSQRIRIHGHRILFFLSSYFFLGSKLPYSVEHTHILVNKLASLVEGLGISEPCILLRVGSAYGNRKETAQRFCEEISKFPITIRKMLAVTNDDKPSLFSVTDLLSGVFYPAKIPICFRSLAHQFNSGGLNFREALFLSCSTWESPHKAIYFHGQSSMIDDNGISLSASPSPRLSNRIPIFGLNVDVVVESPDSFKTCLKYLSEYKSLKPLVIPKI